MAIGVDNRQTNTATQDREHTHTKSNVSDFGKLKFSTKHSKEHFHDAHHQQDLNPAELAQLETARAGFKENKAANRAQELLNT